MEITFIVLLDKTNVQEFLSSVPSSLFSNRNVWMIHDQGSDFGNLYFPIDSQVFTFQTNPDVIQINEVYKIDKNRVQISRPYGSWSEERFYGRLRLDN